MISRRAWTFRDGVLLMGLSALAIACAWPIWREIFEIAITNEEQSHILLAPVVVALLVYVRRGRLRLVAPEWSLTGPLVIGAGWLLGWFGLRFGMDIAYHSSAVLMLAGAVLTVLGPRFFYRFAPAVGALAFVIPIPGRIRQQIAIPLQEASAAATQFGLELFGIPVTLDGNVLSINAHEVAVAEACNGMRMVAALALISYAFVFWVPMRNSVRLLILAVSPIIALVVNIIRLVPTTVLYGYADADFEDLFHDLSGWAVLAVALLILWGFLALLRWFEVPVAPYTVAEE